MEWTGRPFPERLLPRSSWSEKGRLQNQISPWRSIVTILYSPRQADYAFRKQEGAPFPLRLGLSSRKWEAIPGIMVDCVRDGDRLSFHLKLGHYLWAKPSAGVPSPAIDD